MRRYLETGNATEAYRQAGYHHSKYDSQEAHRLLCNKWIAKHLERIKANAMTKMILNVDDVVQKFLDVYNEAVTLKDFGNANRALENLAKYLGMFVSKSETVTTNINITDPEELDQRLQALLKVANSIGETKGNA